jgi:hypothetical protein
MTFPLYIIDSWTNENLEYLGTKAKAWFTNPNALTDDERARRYLFKQARPNTGEDWSEKIACEIAARLGLPHAQYELASYLGKRGIISPNFLPPFSDLVVGNEVLTEIIPGYRGKARYDRKEHTVTIAMDTITALRAEPPIGWTLPSGILNALDVFIGYLLLDAWVCNADRHDENWGFVVMESASVQGNPKLYLAPTFDHASCLGRELTDDRRTIALTTKDKNQTIVRYMENCGSGFFASADEKKTMKSFDVFKVACAIRPVAAKHWLQRLKGISDSDIATLFEQIPNRLISGVAVEFGKKLLAAGAERLLTL